MNQRSMLDEYKCTPTINGEAYFPNDCYIAYEDGFYEGTHINN